VFKDLTGKITNEQTHKKNVNSLRSAAYLSIFYFILFFAFVWDLKKRRRRRKKLEKITKKTNQET